MLLEISQLNTFYGRLHALWDVNMKVEKGTIVALIGSNGAGKSTLLKSIAGTVKPRSGKIVYNGGPIAGVDGAYMNYPVTVEVGGATIFVLNVDHFEKI